MVRRDGRGGLAGFIRSDFQLRIRLQCGRLLAESVLDGLLQFALRRLRERVDLARRDIEEIAELPSVLYLLQWIDLAKECKDVLTGIGDAESTAPDYLLDGRRLEQDDGQQ